LAITQFLSEMNDALAKCNAITHAIVDVGGNQDELAGKCRMVTKVLRQRAGLLVVTNPQPLPAGAPQTGSSRRRAA
jgi:hypothetical protein